MRCGSVKVSKCRAKWVIALPHVLPRILKIIIVNSRDMTGWVGSVTKSVMQRRFHNSVKLKSLFCWCVYNSIYWVKKYDAITLLTCWNTHTSEKVESAQQWRRLVCQHELIFSAIAQSSMTKTAYWNVPMHTHSLERNMTIFTVHEDRYAIYKISRAQDTCSHWKLISWIEWFLIFLICMGEDFFCFLFTFFFGLELFRRLIQYLIYILSLLARRIKTIH